jgi:hypothetical protein
MQQAIILTGLGTSQFQDSIQSVLAIEEEFSRQVGDRNMVSWKNGEYLDWVAMHLSNRYFTPRRGHPSVRPVTFDHLVDPHGTLESLAGEDRVHCADNVVEYYELTEDKRYAEESH